MKTREIIAWFIVVLLLTILLLKKDTIRTIEIPAKSGHFEKVEKDLKPVDSFTITTENIKDQPPQKQKVKVYKEVYRDDVQAIKVYTESTGIILKQSVDYEIFSETIDIKIRQPSINVFVGVQTQISPMVEVSPTLYILTPKVLYSGGYNLQNKAITLGIAIKLF